MQKKLKSLAIVLSVFLTCALAVPMLVGCGNRTPWYVGEWMLFFDGVRTDVASDYEGTTIEINEDSGEITFTILGNVHVFDEIESFGDNIHVSHFNFSSGVVTMRCSKRCTMVWRAGG